MNLKTTFVLLALVVVGIVLFLFGPELPVRLGLKPRPPNPTGTGTLALLENELQLQNLTRIDVRHGDQHITLERSPGGAWALPGRWPVRKLEADRLVALLGGLRSRFTPDPLEGDAPDLKKFGLDRPAVAVAVTAGGKEYSLEFGERAEGEGTRFSRPTYLRLSEKVGDKLEGKAEVIRLAPGLAAELSRPLDYYQQRRLFLSERVARAIDSAEKVEQLAAKTVAVRDLKNPDNSYTLSKVGDEWQLTEPHRELPDPDKRAAILTALPDVWAERFVDKADLAKYGLEDPPQRTLSVTTPDGQTITLVLGKESRRDQAKPPPEPNPLAPPRPPMPQEDTVYHYAKLQDNSQVFEVRFNKLQKDVLIAAAELRDPRVARFRTQDVQRIELTRDGQKLVLVKDKSDWRIDEPIKAAAENNKVTDLLAKLSSLEARDKESVRYKSDPKVDGLDHPTATVTLMVEETASGGREPAGAGDKKEKKARTFTLLLGKLDAEKPPRLYVKLDSWDRISRAADDGLLGLVKQPALAYRGRRLLDFDSTDLARIEIQRNGETFALSRSGTAWKLNVPGEPEADQAKASSLADDLGRLEAVEFVSGVKPEEHGLDKPELTAILSFKEESKKPERKLLVGKQRAGKQEFFARLDGADEVFVVRNDLRDSLNQGSLAFRPLRLWNLQAGQIASLGVEKSAEEKYRLTRKGEGWQITGPFEAAAMPAVIGPMTAGLAGLRAERYEAHVSKDPLAYGLDKPYLRLALTTEKEGEKERVLVIGKTADEAAGSRFARLGDGEAVVVLGAKAVAALDRAALDLLDRRLLSLEPTDIERVRVKSGEWTLVLERKADGWQVVESPAGIPFTADRDAVGALLDVWSPVEAVRFVAYGPKAELARYGLDQPSATVAVTVKKPGAGGGKDETIEHTLALGKEIEGGGRYARLDNGPAVMVLSPLESRTLARGHLDYVDRVILRFDAGAASALVRRGKADALEVVKRDSGWQLVKPADQRADDRAMQDLLDQLGNLRAIRIAAYPVKDLKPYGLDEPAATLTVRLTGAEGKVTEQTLLLGKADDEAAGDLFVQAAGSQAVAVVPGSLARRLTAGPLGFRDRGLARFPDADRAILERGPRKAVFARVDGTWKLLEPVAAEAEPNDLEDFLSAIARLRADELVAEKPGDLKPYGLDRPEARWRFQSGDKEVLNLLVGDKEKNGPRRYARLAAGDLVFLLDPRLSAQALAEYRNRTVWPAPLDAVQVEALTYRTAGGSFTLRKVDEGWQVVGKPEVKPNAQTVNETLAALAGLKADRFVQDQDADLNLYGLEPAELVVEVETRNGKHLLHLGRPEGESRRFYARVPEKSRPGVFIIAERDAARLVRDLTAFTRPPSGDGSRPGP